MKELYLIGMDLGTTMLKGIAMKKDGTVVATAKEPSEYVRSEGNRVEFDIEKFYEKISNILRGIMKQLPEDAEIGGISMASASGNTVVLDENWKPLYPVFSWLDRRIQGEVDQIFDKETRANVRQIVGWGGGDSFPMAHLSWLRVRHPEILDKAAHIGLSSDYIFYRLTGRFAIDYSTATTFFMQNQCEHRWHKPYLDALGITEAQLPELMAPGTLIGHVTEQASKETGLPVGTPVAVGTFDHPSAARGVGVLKEGEMLLSTGTSWVGFYPINDRQKALNLKMIVDPFLQPNGPWGAMFSLESLAHHIEKYIDTFIDKGPNRFNMFNEYSEASVAGAHGLKIDPRDEPDMERLSKWEKKDIARAVMEGTANLMKERMAMMAENGLVANRITMVGGPSESGPWAQVLCNILGVPMSVVNGSYAGAVGAATLAGIAGGIYASLEDAHKQFNFTRKDWKPGVEL